jgi:hypothetical protein
MPGLVAEQVRETHQAGGHVPDRGLLGHADRAVQLDAFLADDPDRSTVGNGSGTSAAVLD